MRRNSRISLFVPWLVWLFWTWHTFRIPRIKKIRILGNGIMTSNYKALENMCYWLHTETRWSMRAALPIHLISSEHMINIVLKFLKIRRLHSRTARVLGRSYRAALLFLPFASVLKVADFFLWSNVMFPVARLKFLVSKAVQKFVDCVCHSYITKV